jgi:hypothetical protein
MKSRLPLLIALATILSVACTSPPNNSVPANYLGEPGSPSAATRTIVVEPGTRWVNVTGGDIVKFKAGGKTFVWNFDVADGVASFELNRIAPPGALNHPVVAYVAPNPLYFW